MVSSYPFISMSVISIFCFQTFQYFQYCTTFQYLINLGYFILSSFSYLIFRTTVDFPDQFILAPPVENSPHRAPDEVSPHPLVAVQEDRRPFLPPNVERSNTLKILVGRKAEKYLKAYLAAVKIVPLRSAPTVPAKRSVKSCPCPIRK